MKILIIGIMIISSLTFCSSKTEKGNRERKEEIAEVKKIENTILGIWTDGSGPNASIRIEEDSLYYVEHFESIKYELRGDSLIIYYEDDPFKAKIIKNDADSLIYISKYGKTVMWKFKD